MRKLFILCLSLMITSPALAQAGKYVAASGPQNSGENANFSDWYSLCTPDLPSGYHIADWSYALSGDRSCGAWADCEVTEDSDIKKCVRFRMQGHNEGGGGPILGPIFAGNRNNGSRQSEMSITYTLQ